MTLSHLTSTYRGAWLSKTTAYFTRQRCKEIWMAMQTQEVWSTNLCSPMDSHPILQTRSWKALVLRMQIISTHLKLAASSVNKYQSREVVHVGMFQDWESWRTRHRRHRAWAHRPLWFWTLARSNSTLKSKECVISIQMQMRMKFRIGKEKTSSQCSPQTNPPVSTQQKNLRSSSSLRDETTQHWPDSTSKIVINNTHYRLNNRQILPCVTN